MSFPKRILFVCMGNICRSPMGEALLRHHAKEAGIGELRIDSAGIGAWHAGEPPDERMCKAAKRKGIVLKGQARQIRETDFEDFDLILCSDGDILKRVLGQGGDPDRTKLMLDYHPERGGQDVPDPYYGGKEGFNEVFDMLDETCLAIIDRLGKRPS
ncbi:MAG: low molecular weight phosphotyrosine protein phosphatase [Phycisphaerales bacterium]|nr:low molecular weight phosphotyrosine protein phosphatase [Phycisphaerales bacterium]